MMQKTRRAPGRESAELFESYANHFVAFFRGDDVRVIFGQFVPTSADPLENYRVEQDGAVGDAVVEQRAAITMSWQMAKLLHATLGLSIRSFEKLNGEIRINAPEGCAPLKHDA